MDEWIFQITADLVGERLDKFLAERFSFLSRMRLQQFIKDGDVQVNGKLTKSAYRLEAGDVVTLEIPDTPISTEIEPEDIPLDILYEDEHLVAINKPAGMVVHPAPGLYSGTLVNALLARYPHLRKSSNIERAGIVHRLDRYTSGVILATLTEESRLHMVAKFQQREIIKVYWALVDGHPPSQVGTIEAGIARSATSRNKMVVQLDGKDASTDFRVLKYYRDHAWLELHPETGRTHQIRVHLAFIKTPIVGDLTYGRKSPTIVTDRFFLHARSITFKHPISHEDLFIEAPLAPELQEILDNLAEQEGQEGSRWG